jgi:hypothetical protein
MSQVKYFFCYAREDSEFVLKLATALRDAGVELWLDQLDILGGQHWDRTVEEALSECGGMLVVMSPESVTSNNVLDEVSYALEEQKLVVPILLRVTSIPFRLRRLHYIDFSVEFDGAFSQLLKAFQIKQPSIAKPQEQPPKKSSNKVELPTILNDEGERVLPVALGIETLGGVFTKLISENTPLPVRHTETFSTASDNQTSVEVSVFAGLRHFTKDNLSIAKFHLIGIPAAHRGVPQIEVAFEIDINGIVNISAKDLGTGREQAITISSSFSEADVAAIVRDAESYRLQDAAEIEEFEARNKLDDMIYVAENAVRNRDDRPELISRVKEAIADAQIAMSEGGAARLNLSLERLGDATNRLNLSRSSFGHLAK